MKESMSKTSPVGETSPVDDYIAKFPENVRIILTKIRDLIRATVPEAEEVISYQMPTYKLGVNLVHFAGHKNHIGLYPTPSGVESFQEELKPYQSGKGSIQFPLDKEIPYDLIQKIVLFRVQEVREKNKQIKSRKQK